jgi:RHS repeat-associated protein
VPKFDPPSTNNGGGFVTAVVDSLQFLHTDHLGSPVAATDADGNVVGTASYYPFGELRQGTGLFDTTRGFTGQIHDAGTGLNFYNARYMDSALGRFISPDSIVPNPANPSNYNRFAYVNNSPLVYTDPTGHCSYVGEHDSCDYIAEGSSVGFGIYTQHAIVRMAAEDERLEQLTELKSELIQTLQTKPGLNLSKSDVLRGENNAKRIVKEAHELLDADNFEKLVAERQQRLNFRDSQQNDNDDSGPSLRDGFVGVGTMFVGAYYATQGTVTVIASTIALPETGGLSASGILIGIGQVYVVTDIFLNGLCIATDRCFNLPYLPVFSQ